MPSVLANPMNFDMASYLAGKSSASSTETAGAVSSGASTGSGSSSTKGGAHSRKKH